MEWQRIDWEHVAGKCCCYFKIFLLLLPIAPFAITGGTIWLAFGVIMCILLGIVYFCKGIGFCCEVIYNCYLWILRQPCCCGEHHDELSVEPDDHGQDPPFQIIFPIQQEDLELRREKILTSIIHKVWIL